MDEKLQIQLNQYRLALSSLDEVLRMEKNQVVQDSTIQRFEYSFDLAWKVMKSKLNTLGIYSNSPRQTITEAYSQQLISYNVVWLEMLETRNLTSHTYNSELAEKVYSDIKNYYPIFLDLLEKLSSQPDPVKQV